MQPYLFPYIGYFQLMKSIDTFVILDDVNFIKKGWINRNRILLNGRDYLFTLPVQKMSQNRSICETRISSLEMWKVNFFKTLEHAYAKAPFYTDVYDMLEEIFAFSSDNISLFNLRGLKIIAQTVGITAHIVDTSTCYQNHHLRGQDRIIDICKRENATMYINLPGGRALYDKKMFSDQNIVLQFIEPQGIVYGQLGNTFVPNLSIIDLLMFNDKNTMDRLLLSYSLAG